MKTIKLEKKDVYFFGLIIGFLIMLMGGASNFSVMENNNCKMPVLSQYSYETGEHISFDWDNKPSKWYLSDIITIRKHIYSIGDILLITGALSIFLFMFLYNHIMFKNNERVK